jgi:hypothetical protein
MSNRFVRLRVTATAALVAALSITTLTQAPRVDFRLATGHGMWNTITADIDGDGEQELIIATLDGSKFNELTFRTPLYIVSVVGGRVVDRSAELFDTRPTSWNTTLTPGDFDGDGRVDLLLCDRGRNVGPNPPPGDVLVDGVRGAQNQVFFNRDGKLRKTDGFPNVVTSSWGCSAGDVDRSGRATIAINTFYGGKGTDKAFLLTWDGAARFVQTRSLLASSQLASWGPSATADFDGNGFADVSGINQVAWSGPGSLAGTQPIAQSTAEKAGYTFGRTTLTADFTGDGLPDLVKINSLAEPSLAEARFALYAGDRRLGLTEKVDAFPAIAAYRGNDNSHIAIAVDLNFDGALDIAGLGAAFGEAGCQRTPEQPDVCTVGSGGRRQAKAVWLNDGTGRFSQRYWADPIQAIATCDQTEAFFLGTSNPKKYHVIYGGCGVGYVARTVTDANPLVFTP